ncbi:hypothetical protein [Pararcticibacter amylolyticus]|uniref:Uncharacterized protein n=1 Tax=Pararcticibacter amylolyticus TaxID=2173175 RepID=A0A2U2PK90_9SPHI|nr:hypothetical protein [Pararcticibacter amylolyticus]PWG81821.1 hypothetical protein DDR33_05535 [Pararcticibacter amylolyticus]
MKPLIFFLSLFTACFFSCSLGYAQTKQDSIAPGQRVLSFSGQKRIQLNFYKRTLKIDSIKAEQVDKVQSGYKESMKALEADKSLSLEIRRERIRTLIEERNRKLATFLSPEQQEQIVPSSER